MSDVPELLYHVIINDPPSRWVMPRKRKAFKDDGTEKKEDVYYLTANIFYGDTHWAIKGKIVNYAKDWIFPFLHAMPKMEKCQIGITYHCHTDGFDLDNKAYFWIKIILDLMKTPSSAQIIEAEKYKNPIKTVRALPDDTVRYVDQINMRYKKGSPAIELKVFGRLLNEQVTLFK